MIESKIYMSRTYFEWEYLISPFGLLNPRRYRVLTMNTMMKIMPNWNVFPLMQCNWYNNNRSGVLYSTMGSQGRRKRRPTVQIALFRRHQSPSFTAERRTSLKNNVTPALLREKNKDHFSLSMVNFLVAGSLYVELGGRSVGLASSFVIICEFNGRINVV